MNGLYIGSFDCFSNGHLDILEQAIPLFDKIYVAIGIAPHKKRRYTIESSLKYIHESIKDKPYANKIEIITTNDLAVDCAQKYNCSYLIRGIRNTTDYAYEENIATFFKKINKKINTIYFYTNLAYISSTAIDELIKHNRTEDSLLYEFVPYQMDVLERSY